MKTKTKKIESRTEYFAKKRLIQQALKAFKEDQMLDKIIITSKALESDADWDKPITFEKTIERQHLTQVLDYENINEQWEEIVKDPLLGVKGVILKIFEEL